MRSLLDRSKARKGHCILLVFNTDSISTTTATTTVIDINDDADTVNTNSNKRSVVI